MAVINWTGNGDGSSWFDQANWEDNAIPGSTDDVVINVEGNRTIKIDSLQSLGAGCLLLLDTVYA